MSILKHSTEHVSALLEDASLTSSEILRITEAAQQFVRRQDWQDQIDNVIIEAHERILELRVEPAGPPGQTTQATAVSTRRIAHTDGACIGNPGPGGWCAVITKDDGEHEVVSGQNDQTTNNRMEMMAVIAALRTIGDEEDVEIVSDSQYVCKAFNNGWLAKWQNNGWRTSTGAVLNQDLWSIMAGLVAGNGRRTVKFRWVKGHSGNELNEKADQIARAGAENAARQPAKNGRSRKARGNRR